MSEFNTVFPLVWTVRTMVGNMILGSIDWHGIVLLHIVVKLLPFQ